MKKNFVDLRSDTVTKPTGKMLRAISKAEVGDDGYREDPTVNKLEELGAEKVGKEAALFVPSGTMGNQTAIMTHTNRGGEVIVEAESHIFYYEVAGMAALSGVQPHTIPGERGVVDPSLLRHAVRPEGLPYPPTELICMENTHNRAGGAVIPLANMEELRRVADEYSLPIHLDGARIFNAAAYLEVDVREIAGYADSVMFCLSKGLCAPVGSLLAGDREFIDRARKMRKLLGGGMRQAGLIAACGIVALEEMTDRLVEDHERAEKLASGLSQIQWVRLDPGEVQTNIVIFYLESGDDAQRVVDLLKNKGILCNATGPDTIRMVTHYGIDDEDIDRALEALSSLELSGCY